jgi:hypothetical protein
LFLPGFTDVTPSPIDSTTPDASCPWRIDRKLFKRNLFFFELLTRITGKTPSGSRPPSV